MINTYTTIIFLSVVTLIIVIYDIYAEVQNNEFTVSFVLGSIARKAPIIALVLGILMGHFFWSQCFNN